MNQSVLIVGATSGIAEAVARLYAEQRARLFLVARDEEKLVAISTDLKGRGATDVRTFVIDANDSDLLSKMADTAWQAFEKFDVALVAHGTLPDQLRSESDIAYAVSEFRTNAESVLATLIVLASRFEMQATGLIAVIGSVAGDRGRGSNYLYGAAKSAIDTFASGLRVRLHKRNVHVLTIKPGFVATPMTAELNLPALLTATPSRVARDIQRAINRRQDVLYTPWFWSWIMLVIRLIPSAIFKRLKV